jgi:hypothetical protein
MRVYKLAGGSSGCPGVRGEHENELWSQSTMDGLDDCGGCDGCKIKDLEKMGSGESDGWGELVSDGGWLLIWEV